MKQLRGNLLLLLTAMIWGAAFVAQRVGMDHVGPYTFLCTRSILGGMVLLPVIFFRDKHAKNTGKQAPSKKCPLILGGIFCGIALFVASAFQQIGIQETTAGKAGFLTAMYMILVPIVGLFFGKKPGRKTWGAVVVALVGMYLLCLWEGGFQNINRGDVLELICALCFTGHILIIDYFSPKTDGVKMSCIQFFVCGILSGIFMLLLEQPSMDAIFSAAAPILYAGILSSGVGYTLQIVAQKDTDPTIASLLMRLESVFSLIFGWLLLHEALSGIELLGCGLMFLAIIWVQLPEKHKS